MALKKRAFTIPEMLLIAGTRVALGIGVGLLISKRLNNNKRKTVGGTLLAVGALTTIPIIRNVLAKPTVAAV
jgi:hypothetical protein